MNLLLMLDTRTLRVLSFMAVEQLMQLHRKMRQGLLNTKTMFFGLGNSTNCKSWWTREIFLGKSHLWFSSASVAGYIGKRILVRSMMVVHKFLTTQVSPAEHSHCQMCSITWLGPLSDIPSCVSDKSSVLGLGICLLFSSRADATRVCW